MEGSKTIEKRDSELRNIITFPRSKIFNDYENDSLPVLGGPQNLQKSVVGKVYLFSIACDDFYTCFCFLIFVFDKVYSSYPMTINKIQDNC